MESYALERVHGNPPPGYFWSAYAQLLNFSLAVAPRGTPKVATGVRMDRAGGRPNGETTPMRTLAEFTKTTPIGGVLIILPVYLAALLLAKTVKGILELLSPVTSQIPAAVEFRQVLAIALLVAVCFIVGLIVRTGPGLRAKNAFERSVLEKLP